MLGKLGGGIHLDVNVSMEKASYLRRRGAIMKFGFRIWVSPCIFGEKVCLKKIKEAFGWFLVINEDMTECRNL